MVKIPTAEEFLKDKLSKIHEEEIFEDLLQKMFTIDISEALIEFAKLHVEAAIKEASEKCKLTSGTYYPFLNVRANQKIDKHSILNSYPLENIN